jgi:hypothetical protein
MQLLDELQSDFHCNNYRREYSNQRENIRTKKLKELNKKQFKD